TFVTREDEEALANIEKLTGMTIPEFKAEPDGKPQVREDREHERRSEATKAEPRKEREPRAEKPAPEKAAAEQPDLPARENEAKPRRRRSSSRSEESSGSKQDGWNGPVPGFLNVSALA